MNVRVYTAPAVEPLNAIEVEDHCRIDSDASEHMVLDGLIRTAREFVENYIGRALITQTLDLVLDGWPGSIVLPRSPVQTITSITYVDYLGVSATVPVTDYYLDDDNDPARVVLNYGKSWPTVALRPSGAIVVRYEAGYGDAGPDVPQSIRQAMLLLIGYWYENREAAGDHKYANGLALIPFAVQSLLAPYRTWAY